MTRSRSARTAESGVNQILANYLGWFLNHYSVGSQSTRGGIIVATVAGCSARPARDIRWANFDFVNEIIYKFIPRRRFPNWRSTSRCECAGSAITASKRVKEKIVKKQVISTVRAKCIYASFFKSKEQERAFLVLHFCSDEVNIFRSLNLNDILKYSWKWKDWSI